MDLIDLKDSSYIFKKYLKDEEFSGSGKIGIFDSGFGGLAVLKEIARRMPDYNYIYLGDNLNAPYGNRTQDEIFKLTLAGAEWLFSHGAEIVILACNTASSNALRKIQKEILPARYPYKKILGIIIPTVENIGNFSRSGYVGILSTKATLESKVFEIEAKKKNPEINIISESGGDLAKLIETDSNEDVLLAEIKEVADKLLSRSKSIDTVILGCTHYALIAKDIEKVLPKNIKVIRQGKIIAAKLEDYLKRHTEIRNKLKNSLSMEFFTTCRDENVKKLMSKFYGENISVSSVNLK